MLADLKDVIVEKIAELGEIEPEEVSKDSSLRARVIDDRMAIELVVFSEKKLQRSFPEERWGRFRPARMSSVRSSCSWKPPEGRGFSEAVPPARLLLGGGLLYSVRTSARIGAG